jgi:hypothetical protein
LRKLPLSFLFFLELAQLFHRLHFLKLFVSLVLRLELDALSTGNFMFLQVLELNKALTGSTLFSASAADFNVV